MRYLLGGIIAVLLLTSISMAATTEIIATNAAVVIGCSNKISQANEQDVHLLGSGKVGLYAQNHAIAIGAENFITQKNDQYAYLIGSGAITEDATNSAIAISACCKPDGKKHPPIPGYLAVMTATKDSTITVIKQTIPEGDITDFDFTGDLRNFTLQGDGDWEKFRVGPGVYEIIEIVPDGWELSSVECTGGTNSCCTEIENGIKLDLPAGESVNVTFSDTKIYSAGDETKLDSVGDLGKLRVRREITCT